MPKTDLKKRLNSHQTFRFGEKERLPLEIEKEDCLLCGQNLWRLECVAKDELTEQNRDYFYFRCRNCGFVILHQKPSQDSFDSIYSDSYPAYLTDQKRSAFLNYVLSGVNLKRSHRVLQYRQRGRLLDIGCAIGDFLGVMTRKEGWVCLGIEPSPEIAKEVEVRLGISVIPSSIEEAALKEASFDVVTAWDVLEHVREPRLALNKIHRWLKDDGLFVASMPNISSLEYRLFRGFWFNLDPPRHFWHYTPRTIRRLLEEEHFQLIRIETSLWSSCEAFLKSWKYLIRRWGFRGRFFLLSRIPLLVVFFPILGLSHLLNGGSILFLWARKKVV